MNDRVKLPRTAKGERPYYFDDPAVDKLLSMLMGLAGEVSVMRDRMDTVERLAEEKGVFGQADIEAYQPTPAVLAARVKRREEFLNEITRIIQVEPSGTDAEPAGSYAAAIELVQKDL
ncbi:MAG: hypothetical protein O6763_11185 [Gammaproteobacteria bacterium]|nr:hypothetical protein [Gammaproteobacteria bacterium]